MSTSSASERVEITPELLDAWHSAASTNIVAGTWTTGLTPTPSPALLLALVERIRELERENERLRNATFETYDSLDGLEIS